MYGTSIRKLAIWNYNSGAPYEIDRLLEHSGYKNLPSQSQQHRAKLEELTTTTIIKKFQKCAAKFLKNK